MFSAVMLDFKPAPLDLSCLVMASTVHVRRGISPFLFHLWCFRGADYWLVMLIEHSCMDDNRMETVFGSCPLQFGDFASHFSLSSASMFFSLLFSLALHHYHATLSSLSRCFTPAYNNNRCCVYVSILCRYYDTVSILLSILCDTVLFSNGRRGWRADPRLGWPALHSTGWATVVKIKIPE